MPAWKQLLFTEHSLRKVNIKYAATALENYADVFRAKFSPSHNMQSASQSHEPWQNTRQIMN